MNPYHFDAFATVHALRLVFDVWVVQDAPHEVTYFLKPLDLLLQLLLALLLHGGRRRNHEFLLHRLEV